MNASLGDDPDLAGSQIKRFLILHKELDADDGELTRTRKVRRRIVAERYENLINALYSDADHVSVEARVSSRMAAKASSRPTFKFVTLRSAVVNRCARPADRKAAGIAP